MWYLHHLILCLCAQPKIVEALLGYELVQVSCGTSHVVAVTNEREVFAWGRGDSGTTNEPLVFFCFFKVVWTPAIYDDWLLALCPEGRLGLGTQDTHNCPQQVCLPAEFEAQKVVCGVDCSMVISTRCSILACGSNRLVLCLPDTNNDLTPCRLVFMLWGCVGWRWIKGLKK